MKATVGPSGVVVSCCVYEIKNYRVGSLRAISSPINELFSRADEDVLSCSVYQTAINRVS